MPFIVCQEPPEFALDRRRRRINLLFISGKRIKSIPIRIGNEDFKYIHDIYETADSELWLASVGMGVVKARIAGTPDNPVIVDAQRYIINDGELGSNYFFTIYAENEANLLFGNKGYGVFRYNETTNGLEPVSTHKYENMTLNNILAISKDSSNNYLSERATD